LNLLELQAEKLAEEIVAMYETELKLKVEIILCVLLNSVVYILSSPYPSPIEHVCLFSKGIWVGCEFIIIEDV